MGKVNKPECVSCSDKSKETCVVLERILGIVTCDSVVMVAHLTDKELLQLLKDRVSFYSQKVAETDLAKPKLRGKIFP